jgi:ArsR family transcriptional regulator
MVKLKPELATVIARRFAVLGEATRLRLLYEMKARGEASVSELVEATGGAQANISRHLGVLLSERMVARRRAGTRALYRIADPTLIAICEQVCNSVVDQSRELETLASTARGTPA